MPAYNAYTRDQDGNETIQGDEYAVTDQGELFYSKNKDGDDYVVPSIGYISENYGIKYPMTQAGEPIHPKKGNTVYYQDNNGVYHFAKNRAGRELYAKDQNGNEFYPPDNSYIKIENRAVYAKNNKGNIVFPTDAKGNEYYVEKIDVSNSKIPARYAISQDGSQLYPYLGGYTNQQYILNYLYAEDANDNMYYPVDVYSNEFYINDAGKDAGVILLDRYALTWDYKVILPEISGTHYIDNALTPAAMEDELLGRLKCRSNVYKDYLTKQVIDEGRHVAISPTYIYQDRTTVMM